MRTDSREHLAYCRQVEAATIGGLILAPALVLAVRDWLEPEDFSVPHYRLWYAIVRERVDAGQPVDQIILLEELRHREALGPEARHAYALATIAEQVPLPRAAVYYARIVVEESVRRQVAGAGVRLEQVAELPDPAEMLRAAEDCRAAVDRARSRWQQAQRPTASAAVQAEPVMVEVCR